MLAEEIINYLIWVTPVIALFLIIYKFYALKEFQNKHQIYLNLRVFSFYPDDHIYSTSSTKKKDFMIRSNKLTVIIYMCLMPVCIVSVIDLVELLQSWLNNL